MPQKKTPINNNGVSNIVSPKRRQAKSSKLVESSLLDVKSPNLNSSNISLQTTLTSHAQADLICLSHLRWNFVYQRPQHLLSRCAQGRRVFFIEEPIFSSEPVGRLDISQDNSGVDIVVPHLKEGLNTEEINANLQVLLDSLFKEYQISNYICWYYTPMAIAFTRHWQPQAVIYDCMDELSAFKGAPPALKEYEAELFRRADLVFTGGPSLYESKANQHLNVYAFPSSLTYSPD
jgi:UDP-galactopyranose mutase